MPVCPHCEQRIEGSFISETAAREIIQQRDLLRVQKADLENKVERQAAWIDSLERKREKLRKENRVLRDKLEPLVGAALFD